MTTKKTSTTAPTPAPEPSEQMTTAYVARRGVGDGVHCLPPSNPTPDSRTLITELVVPPGELLPAWVDLALAEHLVKVGLVERVILPRTRPDRTAKTTVTSSGAVANPATLPADVFALEAAGVTVTHAGAYRAALAALEAPQETPVPAGVLTMSAADLATHLRDRAVNAALNKDRRTLAKPVLAALAAELVESMRLEVDEYLNVMRPKFDAAAAAARATLAAGVRPGLTAEGALEAGMDVASAWQQWRSGEAVGVLQGVAAIRTTLARALDLGEGPDGDHASGLTSPWVRHGLVPVHRDEDPLDLWLRLAPRLDLVPFTNLDPEDVHEARGGTPYAEIRRKLDARDRRAAATDTPDAAG